MNSELFHILNENVFKKLPTHELSHIYKPGTFIEKINEDWDEVSLARYKYILNLCALEPQIFNIPNHINILERCCMMFSFGDYSLITDDFFQHDLLGVSDPKTGEQVLFINIKRCELLDKYEYATRGMTFSDIYVHPLTVREQSILCLYMIKIYNEVKCEDLRRLKVQAYIDRLSFPKNDTCFLISRVIEFYNSLINNSKNFHCIINFEKISQKMFFLDQESTFSIPIILRRDIEIQLAHVYRHNGLFMKSKEIYSFYCEFDFEIDCLLQLGNKSEATDRLLAQLKNKESTNYTDRVKYSNYCIKIAQLLDDTSYYEKAFSICPSYEPLYHKGVQLFKQKDFNESLRAFQQALSFVPENENILFAYACCLKEVGQFQKASDVFERLTGKNNKKLEYHKNLALCRLYLGDFEKCITSLKNVILDPYCAELFFRLAFNKRLKPELIWVFSKFEYTNDLRDKINLVIKSGILSKDELMESIERNPKLRLQVKDLLQLNK